ncbi:MAG: MoaD/ThiS family protein [Actinomycetaceae bacterium]|nr:MoaD/ThiS family protein [Arcanobacterium sp.]MDD7687031.1 MoaD/ThiS family protein [Actinomycetaceae bacterium]MDY5273312.1 MoaD/ThiS family protein [Arcanobacterium sp.]
MGAVRPDVPRAPISGSHVHGLRGGEQSPAASVRVQYFAGIADAAGVDSEVVELPMESPVLADVVQALREKHGDDFAQRIAVCAFVIHGRAVTADDELLPSASLDVLPPFAGG